MINNYLAYILLALSIIVVPGPAIILTVKNSIRYGYKIAVANILGNFVAMVILGTLSAVGLGAIILASAALFGAIKILGCAYLVFLGIKAWRSSGTKLSLQSERSRLGKRKVLNVFQEGFLVGISNPKAIAFFTALFPQFIDPDRSFFPQFLTLIVTIELIAFSVQLSYALLSSKLAPYLSKEKPMRLFNRITGISFVGFGLAFFATSR